MSTLARILRVASRRVNALPWWRLADSTQEELARTAGLDLKTWRERWERRLARNRKRREARR